MDDRIAVTAGSPARGERLRSALARGGLHAHLLVPDASPAGSSAAVLDVADLHDTAVELASSLSARVPVLVVGGPGELPLLEEAMAAGASDLAVDPGDDELVARVRLLLRQERRRVARRRRETALVELAAASGETVDPTAVLRAILGWLGRALPDTQPAVVAIPAEAGTPLRLVRPGRGAATQLSRTELDEQPELRRVLGGDRVVRLDRPDGAAVAIGLFDGDELLGVLGVRSPVALGEDALRLCHAAAALTARAMASARAGDAANRERERVERAYAERFRELLEANRRLRELSRHRQELLAACAHDLRQPLEAILAEARGLEATGECAGSTAALEAAGTRMEALLDDLLDVHAIETGRLELQARPLDAAALAGEVVESLQVAAREREVPLSFGGPEGGAPIAADPSKLREVVANLVGAALEASAPGEPVRVEVERTPEAGARFTVHAEGPGLPADVLAVLRDGAAPAAGEVGRGLGVAIVRDLVRLHGGAIQASGGGDGGATLQVQLPAAPPGGDGRMAEAADEERPRTRPAVLLVEDDPDTLDLLAGILEDGYEVFTAGDGEEGVRVARAERPDVVLLDLYLPRLDGFGALEELRRDPRTGEIPVIFLSAQRDDLVRARGLHLGAADFVVKPFSAAELRARIDRVLQATRKQAHLRALAQQDALTGLPNFGAFRARLEEEVKRARRYRNDLSAVMLDMDNLKPVNDQLGHAAGNRAIVAIADAIRAELRETDFAARYGGDEFVILLPHADAAHARILAERLRRAVKRIEVDGGSVPLRASFGVAAVGPGVEGGGEALVRAADAALYRAKRTGRDKVCVAGEAEAGRGEEAVHGA